MTYSINWPITVRSTVPFRKLLIPHIVSSSVPRADDKRSRETASTRIVATL